MRPSLNILHFCPSQSFSGLEQYALDMALYQASQDQKVCFVAYPGSKMESKLHEAGIETLPFDNENPLENFKFLPVLNKKMGTVKFDVIHLHSTQDVSRFFFFRNTLKWLGIKWPKTVLQIHLWINHGKKDPWHALTYSALDEVWCSSNPARDYLKTLLPVPGSKIKIVNYGRDISKIETGLLSRDSVRKEWGIPFDAVVVGAVNRFEKSKGMEELFNACIDFVKKNPKLHVVFIGGPSPANEDAPVYHRNIISNHAALPETIRSRIHFLGMLPESYKYLRAFDLYVLPSYEECFSLSLLDAQMAELPVLGTKSGGTPEVVVEGKTGWLFEPRNTEALKAALEKSLHEQSTWKEKGRRAAERVRNEFNQTQIFDQIINNYGKQI